MKQYTFHCHSKTLIADKITPVQMFLQLRDQFKRATLLESTDFHLQKGKFSFLACEPLAEFKVNNGTISATIMDKPYTPDTVRVDDAIMEFMNQFQVDDIDAPSSGLYGYVSYDAIPHFENIQFRKKEGQDVAEIHLQFFRYVIAFDHFYQTVTFYENIPANEKPSIDRIIEKSYKAGSMHFPFQREANESSNMTDQEYMKIVDKAVIHSHRGDTFQMVPSRRFQQRYTGDDFNVYRALRAINPSPYLFYFDYGNFHLFGSSPETQIRIQNGIAHIDPIAGTVKRTGNPDIDEENKKTLLADEKENAEHVMLVDLARNDLSRNAKEVAVKTYKVIQSFSHVMHIVSQVEGKLKPDTNPIRVFGDTFPAGTLSGAPKYRAMELIDQYEPTKRNFYGGSIGYFGFNGTVNHAIFIRSFLSKDHTLYYQAGAGVVSSSKAENELQEVENKLGALRNAIQLATEIEN